MCLRGVEAARDFINEDGGILGRPVELVIYDDAGEVPKATSLYERLIVSDKVDILLGPYATYMAHPAYAVARKHGKALWTVVAPLPPDEDPTYFFNPGVETGGIAGGWNDGFHRFIADWDKWEYQGSAYPETIAITFANNPYGVEYTTKWPDVWRGLGIEPVLVELYDPFIAEFTPLLEKVKAAKPDLWYHSAWFGPGVDVQKLIVEMNLTKDLLFYANEAGTYAEWFVNPELGGVTPEIAEGVMTYGYAVWSEEYHGGYADKFRERYKAEFGALPSAFGATTTFVQLEAAARYINAAGTLDDDELASFVRKHTITTVVGDVLLAEDGTNTKMRFSWAQYQDGWPKIVWPLEIADAKPRYTPKG